MMRTAISYKHGMRLKDAFLRHSAPIENNNPITRLLKIRDLMIDEDHCLSLGLPCRKRTQAFLPKSGVTDREDLVHQVDIRIGVCRSSKPQPHTHARGITLEGQCAVTHDICKFQNAPREVFDLPVREPLEKSMEADVLLRTQLRMKSH